MRLILILLIFIYGCSGTSTLPNDPIDSSIDEQRLEIIKISGVIDSCLGTDIDTIGSSAIFYETENFIVIKTYRAWDEWGEEYNARHGNYWELFDSSLYKIDTITHYYLDTFVQYNIHAELFDTSIIVNWVDTSMHNFEDELILDTLAYDTIWNGHSWVGIYEIYHRDYWNVNPYEAGYYSSPFDHVIHEGTGTTYLPPRWFIEGFKMEMFNDGCKIQTDTIPEDSLVIDNKINQNLQVIPKEE